MQGNIRVLTDAEILAVSGGENSKGGHDGTGGGKGDGLGWLRQIGETIVGAVEAAGKAVISAF